MAELADALDLGSSAARRAGSSPVPGTRQFRARRRRVSPFYILQLHGHQPRILTFESAGLHQVESRKLLHLLQSLIDCQASDDQD
jgi:hypothetical protein